MSTVAAPADGCTGSQRALEEERQVGKIERRSRRFRRARVSDKSRKTDPATGLGKAVTRHADDTGPVHSDLQTAALALREPLKKRER